MTNLTTSVAWVTMVLALAAIGCKTGRDQPMSTLADSQFDALLDGATDGNPASPDHDPIALVSSHDSAVQPIRTLKANQDLLALVDDAPGIVLLDFYADWCGPCRKQAQILHDLQEHASSVNAQIVKINVDEHPRLARKYQASSLPTLIVLQDGEVRQTKTGLTSHDEIKAMLR